ncbi:hypothetical protein DS742_19215 [Lacrimispora amygdalina]|uniref:Uncharacterized protein n=1 Tax=Lacrimispora amygdalina TaxID=253257 RepID=A0A3E2N8M0_9FIRM|nr:hypothetical protein [Clostridium indicum]RFZ77322.1 hypothetical protein DS742_19215 [Clostridium indicum]
MTYVPYVTPDYYKEIYKGSTVPDDQLERTLRQASRHIDSLTYNRIVGRGFSNLTEFQQEVIQEVVCLQADFEHENADEINTILSSYSINGVSAQFGSSWNVFMDKGVAMKRDVYAQLSQTGLCCRLAR